MEDGGNTGDEGGIGKSLYSGTVLDTHMVLYTKTLVRHCILELYCTLVWYVH